MTIKYTKEQLNKFDKDLLIELFLGMQGQMEELSRQTQAFSRRTVLADPAKKWRILNRYVSWK